MKHEDADIGGFAPRFQGLAAHFAGCSDDEEAATEPAPKPDDVDQEAPTLRMPVSRFEVDNFSVLACGRGDAARVVVSLHFDDARSVMWSFQLVTGRSFTHVKEIEKVAWTGPPKILPPSTKARAKQIAGLELRRRQP